MRRSFVLTVFCFLICGAHVPAHGNELIIVALANTQAPGFPEGTKYTIQPFDRWSVNTAGQVVFKAVVNTPGPNTDVIYFGYPGALDVVAMQGDPVPGTVADTFCNFDTNNPGPSMIASTDGKVAFTAVALAPDLASNLCAGSGRVGIWVYDNGVGQLLALEGEQAADSEAGVIYSDIRPKFRHSNHGTIFKATLESATGTSLGQVILSGVPGAVKRLAFLGDPAPGQPGKTYAGFVTTNYVLPHNNSGQSSFWSIFDSTSDQGIYRGDNDEPTQLKLLWKSGADASDFLGGYTFINFGSQQPRSWGLNDAAHACFSSNVAGPNSGDPVHDTVWRDLGPSRAVVAATDIADPGISEEFEFSGFTDCLINDTGRVLLQGTATSTIDAENRGGLWLSNEVGQAPALSFITSIGDTLFNRDDPTPEPYLVHTSPAAPLEPHINILGSVAFEVNVVNTEEAVLQSIWLSGDAREQLLAHGGQSVMLNNEQQATLGLFLEFGIGENGSGNQDGNPSAMSDDNQVVFKTTVNGDLTGGLNRDAILITLGRGSFIFGDSFETQPFPPPD